ncbi:hypothetical protein WME73_42805 [Sorangium sp. So ce302]|uniref:hypothetical protein n=1 Tax=Sorangium sp. So ce302 TaxID=3133297 RepID=UPI003F5FD43D
MIRSSRAATAAMTSLFLLPLGACVTVSGARPPAAATAPSPSPEPATPATSPAPAATAPATAATAPATAATGPAAPAVVDLDALYSEAIFKSAVVTPAAARKLVPLKPDANGTYTVTTWAGCRGDGGPNRCGAYVAQQPVNVKWDVWVTSNGELQNKCKTWTGDVVLQIHQVLGMSAPQPPLPADTTERQFVTFSGVPAASIFRPCTDARVDTDSCNGTKLPEKQSASAPADYYRWFTNHAMSSWQVPEKGQTPTGFPWTRLGYSYNWAPGADIYGASEYVVSGGAKAVKLTVAAVQTAKDFCKP